MTNSSLWEDRTVVSSDQGTLKTLDLCLIHVPDFYLFLFYFLPFLQNCISETSSFSLDLNRYAISNSVDDSLANCSDPVLVQLFVAIKGEAILGQAA